MLQAVVGTEFSILKKLTKSDIDYGKITERLGQIQEAIKAGLEISDGGLLILDIIAENLSAQEVRTEVLDPMRNGLGNIKVLLENVVTFIPNLPDASPKTVLELLAGKESIYINNNKLAFLLDSKKGVSAYVSGFFLSLFLPKSNCEIGPASNVFSCQDFAYLITAEQKEIISQIKHPDLYVIWQKYKDEFWNKVGESIQGVIKTDSKVDDLSIAKFTNALLNKTKSLVTDFNIMNSILTASVKAPDDLASILSAAWEIMKTQATGSAKELARDAVAAVLRVAMGMNAFGVAQRANELTGLLAAQFATPDEYPFDIKVENSNLSFKGASLKYSKLDYSLEYQLNYEQLDLDTDDYPCYGYKNTLIGDTCTQAPFFIVEKLDSSVEKKNVLMVANEEHQARTRSSAKFFFAQSIDSVQRVMKNYDKWDDILLRWTFNMRKLKEEGDIDTESDWIDFNPEQNNVPNNSGEDGLIKVNQIYKELKEEDGVAYFDFFDVLVAKQSSWLALLAGRAEASVLLNHKSRGIYREIFSFDFANQDIFNNCGEEAKISYPKQSITYYKVASAQDILKNKYPFSQVTNDGVDYLCITNFTDFPLSSLAVKFDENKAAKDIRFNKLPVSKQICFNKEAYSNHTFAVYDSILSQYVKDHKLVADIIAMPQLTRVGARTTLYTFLNTKSKTDSSQNSAFIIKRTADQFVENHGDLSLPTIEEIEFFSATSSSFPVTFPVKGTDSNQEPLENFTIEITQFPEHGELTIDDKTHEKNLIYQLSNEKYVGTDSFEFIVITKNGVRSEAMTVEIEVITDPDTTPPPPFTGTSNLNDTGITWGGNYPEGNNETCTGETIEQQDCSHGRDATHNDDSDGHAGFSFTKVDNGNCVQDNITGLMWEVKTNDGGLHDKDDKYNWYDTNTFTNGGKDGYADDDGAICYGYQSGSSSTYCNTQAFVARVNAAGWCGFTDWRMPNKEELRSIVDYSRYDPAIDTNYFPNTQSKWYWSGSPVAFYYSKYAWVMDFGDGNDNSYDRYYGCHVRLVRGGQ